jgi:DNA replication protein DnaC
MWLSQTENLILLGPSGTGKTHIASAIGYGLIEKGARVFFYQQPCSFNHYNRQKVN